MRSFRWLLAIVAVALFAVACGSGQQTAPATPDDEPQTPVAEGKGGSDSTEDDAAGWTGPNFTVETFDGDTFELAAQEGTPVVLNFWESW